MQTAFGFREIEHTADWELEVWAPDLPGLLEQAAWGMYALSGVKLDPNAKQVRSLSLTAIDAESLLVKFLNELLWFEEDQGLGFDTFCITIDELFILNAVLTGSTVTHLDKEIKAVTFHNLVVRETSHGLCVNIVFDV